MGIGVSVMLGAVGAKIRFAVEPRSHVVGTFVNWDIVGDILMVAGTVGVLARTLGGSSQQTDDHWYDASKGLMPGPKHEDRHPVPPGHLRVWLRDLGWLLGDRRGSAAFLDNHGLSFARCDGKASPCTFDRREWR